MLTTFVQAVQHICQHKTFIEPLRREIVAVIGEHGWTKAGLYHLKLMDDFLKESLRITQGRCTCTMPNFVACFRRAELNPSGNGSSLYFGDSLCRRQCRSQGRWLYARSKFPRFNALFSARYLRPYTVRTFTRARGQGTKLAIRVYKRARSCVWIWHSHLSR